MQIDEWRLAFVGGMKAINQAKNLWERQGK